MKQPMQDSGGGVLRIAYLTAGAGGMFCGSCMHDNTLARALNRKPGVECLLIPLYTPIRTDEDDVSIKRVFLGGITVYLEERIPPLRYAPRWLLQWLNQPWLLRWVAQRAVKTDAAQLGELTVSLLQGTEGHQRRDIEQLVDWLEQHARPNVVALSNVLIGGCIPLIKRRLNCPVWVVLQGDDIFLDELREPHRHRAIELIRRLVPQVDGFLVNSQYYGQHMGRWLQIPSEKLHRVPLCIDPSDLPEPPRPSAQAVAGQHSRLTIGYLARLAPEKGLHLLVDAFLQLKRMPDMQAVRLAVAGWLGPQHRAYAEEQFQKIRTAGWEADFEYLGVVDRQGKSAFLRSIDVLSVPTLYADPKGLFVLEALAAGVPVVQPNHGAFPELIAATGGGLLCEPRNSDDLTRRLYELLSSPTRRAQLGEQGSQFVRRWLHCDQVSQQLLEILSRSISRSMEKHSLVDRLSP